jgi:GAF domain-containing protein
MAKLLNIAIEIFKYMNISQDRKVNRYKRIYQQLKELVPFTDNRIARMATIAAILHHKMESYSWTGFYILSDGELIVGPYQGPLACQLLEKNKGVCWKGVNDQKTIIVPDVHKFPGHIACDPRSRSEIVVPVRDKRNKIVGVLDIDSKSFGNFDETDSSHLENIVRLVYL